MRHQKIDGLSKQTSEEKLLNLSFYVIQYRSSKFVNEQFAVCCAELTLAEVTILSSSLAISRPLQIVRSCFSSGALHIRLFAESFSLVIRDSLLAFAIFLRKSGP